MKSFRMSFKDYVKLRGYEEVPEGNIPKIWFKRNFLPMTMRCVCCEKTIPSPSAWFDRRGYAYCAKCAGVEEDVK